MTVIAMTREIGSLGTDVAAGVAEELNLKIVHSEIVTNHIAERLGVRESAVQRYVDGSASLSERWLIEPAQAVALHVRGNTAPRPRWQRADPRLGGRYPVARHAAGHQRAGVRADGLPDSRR